MAVVTVTHRLRDRFQRRWWVRCWYCDLRLGPFATRREADSQAFWATAVKGMR